MCIIGSGSNTACHLSYNAVQFVVIFDVNAEAG